MYTGQTNAWRFSSPSIDDEMSELAWNSCDGDILLLIKLPRKAICTLSYLLDSELECLH